MKTIAGLFAASFLSLASAAQAQAPSAAMLARTSSQADAAAYCDMITGVADSESALLVTPTVFGTIGVISGADATGGSSTLPPRGRVMAGASYSVASLVRGVAVKDRATAECKRYRAESALRAFLESSLQSRSAGALAAKATVLENGLAHADELLKAQRAAVAESRGTVDELQSLQMRAEALRVAARGARLEIATMNGAAVAPGEPVAEILRDRDDAEKEVQQREAQMRSSMGWDLSARGGYEQILGTTSNVPVFGAVTLSLNIGWLTQGHDETRALQGRVAWVRQQVEGVDDRTELALQRMRALRASEQTRLGEARALLQDLETRQKAIESATGERARAHAQVLWFDRLMVEAEHTYLVTHLAELDAALKDVRAAR